MSGKKAVAFLTVTIFLFLFSIRFIHLSADPPYDLSTSGGPYGDPGGYSFNARNKILFGTWEVDNYNPMYISIVPHGFTYLSFKLLGVGFAQQNLVPVMFSCLSMFFFFLLLRRRFSSWYALLGTTLLGINYLFLMFSRVADRVMPPIAFLLMGLYFLQKGEKKVGWFLGAGFSFLLALISKSVVFYILGAVGLGYLIFMLFGYSLQEWGKRIAYLGAGFFLPFLPWFILIYLPHREYTSTFFHLNRNFILPPLDFSLILKNFWHRPNLLLSHMPFLAITGALFFLVLLYRGVHQPRKIKMLDWIFLSWFAGGHIYYAIIYQRVTRHFIPHIIPLTFLTIYFIHHLLTSPSSPRFSRLKWFYFIFVFLWMIFPVSLLLKFASSRIPPHFFTPFSLNVSLIILSFLGTSLLYVVLKTWPETKISFSFPLKKGFSFSLVIGILAFQVPQYLDWAISPRYQFKHISQDLGKALEKATLAGLWAPVICLENKHRAHEYYPGVINDSPDFFHKYGITHVFTTTAYGENKNFERNFPQIMNKAQLLARYHIWKNQVLLYQVPPLCSEKEEGIFEAELFTQKGNTPRYDKEASSKFAVLSSVKKPHFVIQVPPEKSFLPGKYLVTFRVKVKEIYKKEKRLARFDVISAERRKLFVYKDIYSQDLSQGAYEDFQLKFSLPWAQKLKIRVYSPGSGSFWIDWVKIEKID